MTHPGDAILTAETFDDALRAYRAGLAFERDAQWIEDPREREQFLLDRDPGGHDPTLFQGEIDRVDQATALLGEYDDDQYGPGFEAAVAARLCQEGLDLFAEAYTTGHYAEYFRL